MDLNNQSHSFMAEDQRRAVIKLALMRLKQKNQDFLQNLDRNPKWRKIYNGLLFSNQHSQLPQLIKLELCEVSDSLKNYFNPFEKIPVLITMCYNRYNNKETFQRDALYNLILLYDSRMKKNMNWNNLEDTAKSTVRALNISEICNKKNHDCFEKELQQRVLEKERFKGKEINFYEIITAGLEDMNPISQIR